MGELVLCVPGPWKDRAEFLGAIVTVEPEGRYMCSGTKLVDLQARDDAPVEFSDKDPSLVRAFKIAGQGRIDAGLLRRLEAHEAIAYLRFPLDLSEERERVLRFSTLLERAGGLAIKVESAGIAHTWERWSELLRAGTPFDLYTAVVVLVRDENQYYSCGMHHFGLAECAVARSTAPADAANLINQFNGWQILERPALADGHTFSLTPDSPRLRLSLGPDTRHREDDPFYNPHGVWSLS